MKTFEAWSKAGYKIKKGSKSVKRNHAGVPLFGEDQVEKAKTYHWYGSKDGQQEEYSDEDYEFDRDFGDVYLHDRDWY